MQKHFQDCAWVKTSPSVLRTTIIIIDNRHVLMELPSDEHETVLLGTFHFDDTTGVLVEQLNRLWDRIDKQSILVTKVS